MQLPYADTSVYLDESNPLFASVRDGVCHVKAGSYRAEYPASEQLKKTYSTESSMEELLNHPAVRAFLSTLIEVDMIPDAALSHVSAHRRRRCSAAEAMRSSFRCWTRRWRSFR